MENWGLLTFQTTALLFNEKSSDPEYLSHVAYLVAHELAHQWFGNLVTMEWWNELWLNEGFATWAGWYVVDLIYPEWNVWAQFVGESMQDAFHLDSLHSSHPVEAPVLDDLAVDSLFDDISYSKGSSLIRMLVTYMSVDVFLQGVSEYLHKFAYGNTTVDDLWHSLSTVSGLNVSAVMTPWIMRVGFPVITVEECGPRQVLLRQRRYLWDDSAPNDEDTSTWWVPVAPHLQVVRKCHTVDDRALQTREALYDSVDPESGFRPLNVNQAGFYRIDLTGPLLRSLQARVTSLPVEEQIGLLGDIGASAAASQGSMTTGVLFSFMQEFRSQFDFHVWKALLGHLATIKSIFSSDARVASGLDDFILNITSNAMDRLGRGLRASTPSNYLTTRLRAILVLFVGLAGDRPLVTEVLRRFPEFLDVKETRSDPSLRQAVLSVAVNKGGAPIFKMIMTECAKTASIDAKEAMLMSLGQVPTPELAREYLDFAFNGNIKTQDLGCVIDGLAQNHNCNVREVLWQFIKEQWSRIESLYAGSLGIFEPLLTRSLETLVSDDIGDDVKLFFSNKDTAECAQGLAIGVESIARRARHRKRDLETVRDWLQANGFASRTK